jgi:CRISPR/Cas system-associated exonuclease Cas4 (RecB family)
MRKVFARVLASKEDATTDFRLSVSKSKTFEDCKAKFKYSYIEKLPKKDWDFHIFGKCLHGCLEYFHQDLIDHPKKCGNWAPSLLGSWKKSLEEYKDKMDKPMRDEAWEIVKEYKEILDTEGLPDIIAVEKDFFIELNERVLLNGFIDRIERDPDGVIHVTDYKTTKNKKYLNDFFQLMTYAYALMVEDESIEEVRGSFILLRHNFEYLTQYFRREDVMPIGEKFLKYADDIEKEKTWRPNPQFLCKYCDFVDHCDAGRNYLIKKGMRKPDPRELFGASKW